MKGLLVGFAIVLLTCVAGAAPAPGRAEVSLPKLIHFTAPGGADVQAPAGDYEVQQGPNHALRLASSMNPGPLIIQAAPSRHEGMPKSPMALGIQTAADQFHVILLLPGGAALDASGTYSGVRSRGLTPLAVSASTIRAAAMSSPGSALQYTPPRGAQIGGTLPLLPAKLVVQPSQKGQTRPVGSRTELQSPPPPPCNPPANYVAHDYRITINGFHVDRATLEDNADRDGPGDEAYVAAYTKLINGALPCNDTGFVAEVVVAQTPVYGDTAVVTPAPRLMGGSATPYGGLRTGDDVPLQGQPGARSGTPQWDRLPMVVWEGKLSNSGDVLLIAPSVWESDGNAQNYSSWTNTLAAYLMVPQGWHAELGNTGIHELLAGPMYMSGGPDGFDHPIGDEGPQPANPLSRPYFNRTVPLTVDKIEALLESGLEGTFTVSFADKAFDAGSGGMYTLYFEVERM